jgi:hypothetical protein
MSPIVAQNTPGRSSTQQQQQQQQQHERGEVNWPGQQLQTMHGVPEGKRFAYMYTHASEVLLVSVRSLYTPVAAGCNMLHACNFLLRQNQHTAAYKSQQHQPNHYQPPSRQDNSSITYAIASKFVLLRAHRVGAPIQGTA